MMCSSHCFRKRTGSNEHLTTVDSKEIQTLETGFWGYLLAGDLIVIDGTIMCVPGRISPSFHALSFVYEHVTLPSLPCEEKYRHVCMRDGSSLPIRTSWSHILLSDCSFVSEIRNYHTTRAITIVWITALGVANLLERAFNHKSHKPVPFTKWILPFL